MGANTYWQREKVKGRAWGLGPRAWGNGKARQSALPTAGLFPLLFRSALGPWPQALGPAAEGGPDLVRLDHAKSGFAVAYGRDERERDGARLDRTPAPWDQWREELAELLAEPGLPAVAEQERWAHDGHARVAQRLHRILELALHPVVEDPGARARTDGADEQKVLRATSEAEASDGERVLEVDLPEPL